MKSLIYIYCKNIKLFFIDEIKFKVEKLLKQNNLILKSILHESVIFFVNL